MVSTSTTNPGITSLFQKPKQQKSTKQILDEIRNSGYGNSKIARNGTGNTSVITYEEKRAAQKKALNEAYKNKKASSKPSQNSSSSTNSSSSGSGITTLNDAASDTMSGGDAGYDDSADSSDSSGSSSGSSGTSPLLEGNMSFEELVGDICNGIDLVFATKRSTVVITDYETIFAEAKYLRSKNSSVTKGEDIQTWQLEDGTYELDVNQYGFYNTVKVYYKNGVITESYEDLVKVYGNMVIEYHEKSLDKTSAQMKAKAYLAAHVRDFNMSIKANILWDGDIDVGDIVTIDNPMTLRDDYRTKTEKRDPEYYFVKGKSVEWEGEGFITGSLELTYGPESPEAKDVPEVGTSYSQSNSATGSSVELDTALDEVGKMAAKKSYSHACSSYDCMKSGGAGDCWAMSSFISCELQARNVETKILQYPTSASSRHRSVQYKDANGKWQNFPYRSYGINSLFNDTGGVAHGKHIKGDCD